MKKEKIPYDTYLAERKILIDGEWRVTSHYDTTIITLTAGALALSLVFIEKIAKPPFPSIIPLIIAWSFFCIDIIIEFI